MKPNKTERAMRPALFKVLMGYKKQTAQKSLDGMITSVEKSFKAEISREAAAKESQLAEEVNLARLICAGLYAPEGSAFRAVAEDFLRLGVEHGDYEAPEGV